MAQRTLGIEIIVNADTEDALESIADDIATALEGVDQVEQFDVFELTDDDDEDDETE